MKILFVIPYLATPPRFGAQRRVDGLMRGLARNHQISVLSFEGPEATFRTELAATKEYAAEVVTVPYDVLNVDVRHKRLLQLRSLASRRSFDALLMTRPDFQARLREMLGRNEYDVVQVEFAQMAGYEFPRRGARPPKLVLDEHNIEFDLSKRTVDAPGSVPRKLYSAANWRKLRWEEREAWRRFDGVALTSVRDEELVLEEVPRTKTWVVPNAVDVDAFRPRGLPREPATLLFLGAMNYYPNTVGMLDFLERTWPRLAARRPELKLQIVGMNPPDSVVAHRSERVEITGFVDDPLPYLERATVVIVPLNLGGGTRFKVVEAMAMGKAIVSTRIGAEGIDVVHEKSVLFADEPEAFASQVERLLDSPELAGRLGREARQLAEERYSWRSAVGELERFYEALGAKPNSSARDNGHGVKVAPAH